MNNYDWLMPRRRRQSLFVVEGNHEKNELIGLLLKIFPEIDICLEDILIYGTNIYMLYEELVHIYQESWYEDDVDLPFLVSRKKGYEMPLYKEDFNNIVLIFDYERHDPNFSEDKITKMQEYFHDATDVGKLFINYPMIESYQDLQTIPDDTYEERFIPITLQPGYQYKNLVKDKIVAKMTELPIRIKGMLMGRFHMEEEEVCDVCIGTILNLHTETALVEQIETVLKGYLTENDLNTAKYQLADYVRKCGYVLHGQTYYEYMRGIFQQIILHNIRKANKVQCREYEIIDTDLQEEFLSLNFSTILKKQNHDSRSDVDGIIWILNTSVLFVPDYNYQCIV